MKRIVSKLIKLYHINLTNVRWFFLFAFFMFIVCSLPAQDAVNNKIRTIVIDPGHGGKDPGTMGTKRYQKYEKDIALSVGLKLGKYISNEFPEINVVYTRDTDVFLELNERTELANNANADLFISIHCDGFSNSKVSGASVFVMGMSKLKANLDIAMRENSAIYMEDNYKQKYDGFDPGSPESYIVFSLMQNTYLDQSLLFANQVEREFAIKANRKSRGVKQAPFYVISRTNMPSILVECGFLTNPKEEDFLHSEIGQEYIASAIFRAFRSYSESLQALDEPQRGLVNQNSDVDKIIANDTLNKKNELYFRVQIGTYLESMKNHSSFIGLEFKERVVGQNFKYYVGNEKNKESADKIKEQMIKSGFDDAFVVAFYQDQRISIQEALVLQAEIKNKK